MENKEYIEELKSCIHGFAELTETDKQFYFKLFCEKLLAINEKYGVSLNYHEVERTENILMEVPDYTSWRKAFNIMDNFQNSKTPIVFNFADCVRALNKDFIIIPRKQING